MEITNNLRISLIKSLILGQNIFELFHHVMRLQHHSSRIRIITLDVFVDLGVVVDENIDEVFEQGFQRVPSIDLFTVGHEFL